MGRRIRRRLAGHAWKPQGWTGVTTRGHRRYVGGRWDEIGKLQYEFMLSRGLQPEHVFLDIACGSLRGGVHFIPYLDAGNYLGIDRESVLIERGLSKELPPEVREEKRPEFVVSGDFEFDRFSKRPDFSLAQSLFTHLSPDDIELCLTRLRDFVAPGHQLHASFSEGPKERTRSKSQAHKSHARAMFFYSPQELEAIAVGHGWDCTLVGDWEHPRRQQMMKFLAR